MREFILLALKARTSPDFKLIGPDRMDLVCRTISNALFISNDVRRDTVIHVAMSGPDYPPKTVSFYGETIKGLGFDEFSISERIREALKKGINLKLDEEIDVSDGVKVSKKAFETLLRNRMEKTQFLYMHPKGEDIRSARIEENATFIIGDFIGLPRNTESLLERIGAKKVKLGPVMLFASHCPVIIHNEIDRRSVS